MLLLWLLFINLFNVIGGYLRVSYRMLVDSHNGGKCTGIGTHYTLQSCMDSVVDLIQGSSENIDGLHWFRENGECHYVETQVTNKTIDTCCTSIAFGEIDKCMDNRCDHYCRIDDRSGTPLYCSCREGYIISQIDEATCHDIDECQDHFGGCDQLCNNIIGSYFCSCYDGYTLNQDGKTCDDIDECARKEDGCSDICNNTDGSYECRCRPRRHLLPNKMKCEDDYYEVKVMMPPQEWLNNHHKEKNIKREL